MFFICFLAPLISLSHKYLLGEATSVVKFVDVGAAVAKSWRQYNLGELERESIVF